MNMNINIYGFFQAPRTGGRFCRAMGAIYVYVCVYMYINRADMRTYKYIWRGFSLSPEAGKAHRISAFLECRVGVRIEGFERVQRISGLNDLSFILVFRLQS